MKWPLSGDAALTAAFRSFRASSSGDFGDDGNPRLCSVHFDARERAFDVGGECRPRGDVRDRVRCVRAQSSRTELVCIDAAGEGCREDARLVFFASHRVRDAAFRRLGQCQTRRGCWGGAQPEVCAIRTYEAGIRRGESLHVEDTDLDIPHPVHKLLAAAEPVPEQ